jgi:hypothetical protein
MIQQTIEAWSYPQMRQIYDSGSVDWVAITEEFYWQAMEVLPPIYLNGGFAVPEPLTHDADDRPVYACFAQVGKKHYGIYSTRSNYSANYLNLLGELGQ